MMLLIRTAKHVEGKRDENGRQWLAAKCQAPVQLFILFLKLKNNAVVTENVNGFNLKPLTNLKS